MFHPTATLTLTTQTLADLITTVIETPIGDWLLEIDALPSEYSDPHYYDTNFLICATVEDQTEPFVIDQAAIVVGWQAFATQCPSHLGDLLNEEWDSVTADRFLQCVIYGDVIYG